jgi:hypothetical protein
MYYRSGEEFPVTLQVAMKGTNGWLLASDTKENQYPFPAPSLEPVQQRVRSASNVPKIFVVRSPDLAYMCAGEQVSRDFANHFVAVRKATSQPLSRDFLFDNLRSFCEQDERTASSFGWMVLAEHRQKSLWKLLVSQHPDVSEFYDYFVVGDVTNSARFFLERFYEDRPVEELLFLAAHVIVAGNRLNPTGIGGLEIVFSDGKSDQLTEWRTRSHEIFELTKRSDSLIDQIRKRIFKV